MKRVGKVIFLPVFMLLAVILLTCPISAAAAGDISCVIDRDNRLSESEELRICTVAERAAAETGVIFLVAVYDVYEGIPSGEDAVQSFGFNYRYDDVVLLMIKCASEDTYFYEMFTYGASYMSISDREVNAILDDSRVFDNIKGGNLADGAVAFIEKSVLAINSSSSVAVEDNTPVIIAISLAAGIIAVVVVIITYKTKLKSPIYPLSQFTNLNLTEKHDHFIGKNVTRTKISSSSGSSGSSSRSGGSSGGSRGGR